jgi:hypothetical protein
LAAIEGVELIESFWNICLLHEITTRDQLLREAIRVKRTHRLLEQQQLSNSELVSDPENLFQWVKERALERELGHFPGDRDLFYKLYHAGKDLDLLEYAVHTIRQDRVIGGIIVHPAIMERFIVGCEQRGTRNILIAEAEKYVSGLAETKCCERPWSITLLTENYIIGRLFKTHFESFANVHVMLGSIYQSLPLGQAFDDILAIPNFGMKMNDDDVPVRESEGAASSHLIPLLQAGGRLSVTFPARILSHPGEIADWRKRVNEQAPVQSIHALPDGWLRPYTSVKTYQVEFRNAPVHEVTLGRLRMEKSKLAADKEIAIHPDKFRQLDHWRIELLLDEDQDTLRSYQQADTPKVKLREVAEIFRGKSVLRQDLRPGNIRVLNISNLDDGEVLLDQLETIDEEERKVRRYEILPGDLVMTCRGTVNKLAVFPKTEGMVIASANILVIRFKSAINSHFAKIFLESPVGTALIQNFQRGTTVMNLNPADVAEIELPLLPEDKQREFVHRYLEEKERYQQTVREAARRWDQVKNDLYNQLF